MGDLTITEPPVDDVDSATVAMTLAPGASVALVGVTATEPLAVPIVMRAVPAVLFLMGKA
ncbi:hypothetical protein C3469_23350 [Mycobacterium kansasii]|nr:hypothetical protein B1T52_01585 [Mycobacterium kansasii]POX90668.1 hypothetical protein C3473_23935 [Mycobacterium kansasii]POY01984.1 hypothetical protein C3477_18570 [Mycobacterium kansasii]POY22735.1 hypothetical protein C3469_23350 [Mycobacterium kansasii]